MLLGIVGRASRMSKRHLPTLTLVIFALRDNFLSAQENVKIKMHQEISESQPEWTHLNTLGPRCFALGVSHRFTVVSSARRLFIEGPWVPGRVGAADPIAEIQRNETKKTNPYLDALDALMFHFLNMSLICHNICHTCHFQTVYVKTVKMSLFRCILQCGWQRSSPSSRFLWSCSGSYLQMSEPWRHRHSQWHCMELWWTDRTQLAIHGAAFVSKRFSARRVTWWHFVSEIEHQWTWDDLRWPEMLKNVCCLLQIAHAAYSCLLADIGWSMLFTFLRNDPACFSWFLTSPFWSWPLVVSWGRVSQGLRILGAQLLRRLDSRQVTDSKGRDTSLTRRWRREASEVAPTRAKTRTWLAARRLCFLFFFRQFVQTWEWSWDVVS